MSQTVVSVIYFIFMTYFLLYFEENQDVDSTVYLVFLF